MIKKSIEHLKENKMSYWQHFLFANIHGLRCLKAGFFLICHSFIPALFPRAGSELVSDLNRSFTDHKR